MCHPWHHLIYSVQETHPKAAEDIWSLGVILWELAYLEHPFANASRHREWWQVTALYRFCVGFSGRHSTRPCLSLQKQFAAVQAC